MAMALDARRVILAAAQAAIDEASGNSHPGSKNHSSSNNRQHRTAKQKKQLLPAKRAVLLGAGLMTAGRLAMAGRGREMLSGLADRLEEYEQRLSSD